MLCHNPYVHSQHQQVFESFVGLHGGLRVGTIAQVLDYIGFRLQGPEFVGFWVRLSKL